MATGRFLIYIFGLIKHKQCAIHIAQNLNVRTGDTLVFFSPV